VFVNISFIIERKTSSQKQVFDEGLEKCRPALFAQDWSTRTLVWNPAVGLRGAYISACRCHLADLMKDRISSRAVLQVSDRLN